MNYLVTAEKVVIIEALIEADGPDQAANWFLAMEPQLCTIVSETEPTIVEIVEAP